METKEKSIMEQINNLGVDTNLIYEVGGTLDNLNVLFHYLSDDIEQLLRELERTEVTTYLIDKTKKIFQLTFIINDEYLNAEKSLKNLSDQINA